MTANRIAVNTLRRIITEAAKIGPRVRFLAESAIQSSLAGNRAYVVNLSHSEQVSLERLGFFLFVVLAEARGKKDLCEVTIL